MVHINKPNYTLSRHFIFIKVCNHLLSLKLSCNVMYFAFCSCFSKLSLLVSYLSSWLFGTARPAVDQRNKISAARCRRTSCANLYGRPLCLQSRNLIAVWSLELMSAHQIWAPKFQKVHKDFCFFCVFFSCCPTKEPFCTLYWFTLKIHIHFVLNIYIYLCA